MTEREEILSALRRLATDRAAVSIMREDIAGIGEDEKQKELPAAQREALEKEKRKLEACLAVTEHRVARMERLLALLAPEEQLVLEYMFIRPRPKADAALASKLQCERSSIYRLRALAVSKLTRLRYGAGE